MEVDMVFTTEELELAKKLAYENMADEHTEIGFEYKGTFITNPFMEESGRFELTSFEAMCKYYGKWNVYNFVTEVIKKSSN